MRHALFSTLEITEEIPIVVDRFLDLEDTEEVRRVWSRANNSLCVWMPVRKRGPHQEAVQRPGTERVGRGGC